APISLRRSRSLATAATVNPATNVRSRSKKAPIAGPGGLASTSATDPGSRIGSMAVPSVMRSAPSQLHHFVQSELEGLLELVGGDERRGVVADGQRADPGPGHQHGHHRDP